jgi:S1-C subfamily serine protease
LKGVFDELVETGTVRTPWMGIVGVTLNRGLATHYNLAVDKGALLLEVPKGPSKSAGLQPGDVIVAIDEKEIVGMDDLRRRIMMGRIGDKIKITIRRNHDTLEAYIELTDAPQ